MDSDSQVVRDDIPRFPFGQLFLFSGVAALKDIATVGVSQYLGVPVGDFIVRRESNTHTISIPDDDGAAYIDLKHKLIDKK